MDVACFDTIMRSKDWYSCGQSVSASDGVLLEDCIAYRQGTKTIFVHRKDEINELDTEVFDTWLKTKTRGFIS